MKIEAGQTLFERFVLFGLKIVCSYFRPLSKKTINNYFIFKLIIYICNRYIDVYIIDFVSNQYNFYSCLFGKNR